MNINADDPKWTAYVLGELNETERAALELELEASEEAREFVEELRMAATIMKDGLASEAAFELTAGQRARVHAAVEGPARRPWFSPQLVWAAGLAAACVLIAVTFTWTVMNPRQPQRFAQSTDSAAAPVAQPSPATQTAEASSPELRAKVANETGARKERDALDRREQPPAGVVAAIAKAEVVATNGVIAGLVTDTTNARIPGVTVKAENASTSLSATTFSDATGAYRFSNLPAGTYSVTAQLSGFQTATANLVSPSDQEARADFKLQVAAVSQSVEVAESRESLLKTASASVGQVVPSARKQDLPVVGNTVVDLVTALPPPGGPPPTAFAAPPPPPPASPRNEARQLGQQGQQGQQQQGGAGGRGGAGAAAGPGVVGGVLGGVLAGPAEPVASAAVFPAAVMSTVVTDGLRVVDRPVGQPADNYARVNDNPFIAASQQPLSTFSADVDTASYANMRRFLNQNQLPPDDAVRIEELVNYFSYDYPQASGPHPITGSLDVAAAPWNPQHRLVRVGIKAKDVRISQKASNLVLLIDVSGSMSTPERLPLLKSGMRMLIDRLSENDKISIVTYAAGSGIALQPTSGDRKEMILQAIDNLHAEGGTNGGAGIQTAYEMAVANFIRGGVNRVILATDGDFNVGITDPNQLTSLIEDRARSGVYLTVLGFGNNFKDSLLGRLAGKGHGNYSYIDSLNEARKVLVEQMDSTLVTVAKDVKIQVEFNPVQVNAYRLLGYENRLMAAADFNNDAKDAGDMGSGHTVTALYEVVPRGVDVDVVDGIAAPLRYQPPPAAAARADAQVAKEMLNLRIRYKQPEGGESKLLEVPLMDRGAAFTNASSDFRFAAAVAGFGMILRDSPYKGAASLDWVLATATNSRGTDKNGYRAEFIRLVQQAMRLRR